MSGPSSGQLKVHGGGREAHSVQTAGVLTILSQLNVIIIVETKYCWSCSQIYLTLAYSGNKKIFVYVFKQHGRA